LRLHETILRSAQFLERFTQISGAMSQFAEQSRVLYGDNRLRGEVL
jgi:hypothetical protein